MGIDTTGIYSMDDSQIGFTRGDHRFPVYGTSLLRWNGGNGYTRYFLGLSTFSTGRESEYIKKFLRMVISQDFWTPPEGVFLVACGHYSEYRRVLRSLRRKRLISEIKFYNGKTRGNYEGLYRAADREVSDLTPRLSRCFRKGERVEIPGLYLDHNLASRGIVHHAIEL